ncbi:MAG: hypothetical protein IPM45_15710 [Acidimicrobiales bacterium]|nr:hypothetical protein [Acidimicrobiales bacterium]
MLTRRKILGAVLAVVAEGSLDKLSVPAVWRRAGSSATRRSSVADGYRRHVELHHDDSRRSGC